MYVCVYVCVCVRLYVSEFLHACMYFSALL